MKKIIYVLLAILFIHFFTGCDEQEEIFDRAIQSEIYKENLLSESSFNSDWESYNSVTIFANAGNNNVIVPWSSSFVVSGSIPVEVRTDIKKEDGWEMIGHTLNMPGTIGADRGTNYIFFHNKFTGLFKAFFYMDANYNDPSNSVIWSVGFANTPQNLLKFSHPIAVENSTVYTKNINHIYTSSITISNNGQMGLTSGWNCFQMELAYDPSPITNVLYITPYIGQNKTITMSGTFNAKTDGTILLKEEGQNFLNNSIKSASKFIGKGAGQVVENIIGEGKIANVVEKAVQKEVNNKMSNFIGMFNTSNTIEGTINLTTNGSISMEGGTRFQSQAGAGIVQLPINQAISNTLGAWSLNRPVIVRVSPIAHYKEPAMGAGENEHIYELLGDYTIETPSISINPNIAPLISNLRVTTSLYYCGYRCMGYSINPNVNHSTGSLDTSASSLGSAYKPPFYEGLLYENFKYWYHAFIETEETPYSIDISKPWGNGYIIAYGKGIRNEHIVRVTVTFDARIGNKVNKVISTKTFVPQLEWRSY